MNTSSSQLSLVAVPSTLKPQAPKLESKDITRLMFRSRTEFGGTCNACNKFVKQSKKAGYTNLVNHLAAHHPGYEDVVRTCLREKRAVSMEMFVDRHAMTTHEWMKLVVQKNFTFRDVDDETVRAAVRYDSMSSKTLKARMFAAVELMEPAIVDELRDQLFVLVFDGVTDGGEHSLALFIATPKGTRFLAISSFIDEESMTADEHIRFLDLILDQYGLDVCNLVGIVCDNMETNKAIARRIKAPMIGCAAHRFNLAVKVYLKEYMPLLRKVSTLMRKLKTVKRIAVLRKNGFTLKPVPMHELRWSGIFRMLKRYKELHPYLHFFERDTPVDKDIPKEAPADDARRFPIVKFLPTAEEHCVLMDVLDSLMLLEDSTQRLQRKDLTLLTARDIFDEALIDFPELADRLKADANIVESTNFEAAVVKIMNGLEKDLSSEEIEAAVRLLKEPNTPAQFAGSTRKRHPTTANLKTKRAKTTANTIGNTIDHDSVCQDTLPKPRRTPADVKAALDARAKAREEERSKYIDLSWIPATSVEVERLFSSVKCILGYLRKSMNAETLEAILFLRMNWDLVTNEVTTKCVHHAREVDVHDSEECDSYM